MGLLITVGDAEPLKAGVWQLELPPHQVRLFGDCRRSEGHRSVILISSVRYNQEEKTLSFAADTAVPLNIGKSNITIVICNENLAVATDKENLATDTDPVSSRGLFSNQCLAIPSGATASYPLAFGPGDREFLRVAKELPSKAREAAEMLLMEVRKRSPGDLKRGQSRNFTNTPDNFWYVIVQPRVGELSITVRGMPERFKSSRLPLKQDRPGYSRFKVTSVEDVTNAIDIIFSSKFRG